MPKILSRFTTFFTALSLLGTGCLKSVPQSVPVSSQPESDVSSSQEVKQIHGIEYTSEEAGISVNHEDELKTLVYLKQLYVKDGKQYAVVDPVRFIDCRKLASLHQSLPKDCLDHPEVGFTIENQDNSTFTYEMATSSGPFFLNRISDETTKQWRTMDLPSIQGLLSGKISPFSFDGDYYDPALYEDPTDRIPANLFFLIQKNGTIEKMIEKYRA